MRIFKVNGFESYIEENLEKFRSETKTQEELERYLEALREQCKNYENWFKNKQQRKTTERRKKKLLQVLYFQVEKKKNLCKVK